jgi:putative PIN family toxin of toxin-antitoxin system
MSSTQHRLPNVESSPQLAVLDTQVVLDWLVFRDIGMAQLTRSLKDGRLRWLTCQAMHDELGHVLNRAVITDRAPDRAIISQTIERFALRIEAGIPPGTPLRCSDADDQIFIDLALAAGAQWLFTRDHSLLRLARRARERGVIVLRPADWQPSMRPASSHS